MTMMISKFHKMIQSKIVWGAFALLISVAFVGVYTPGAKSRSEAKRDRKEGQIAGRLFGEEISRIEFSQAWNGVRVMVAMQSLLNPRFNMSEDQIYHAAWQRLATLKKAQQLGMFATPEQTVEMIQRQPLFQNRQTGQFDKNNYDMFVSQILPRVRTTPKEFEQIFEDNVLIEKVYTIPAQGGLATEKEIIKAFHLYTDMLTVEYATIPRSLAGTPEVSDQEAETHYKLNPTEFRMPEAIRVEYVQFAVSNYLDAASLTDEMVAAAYENNKSYFMKKPADDAPADAAPEFKPFDEVKGEIEEKLTMEFARKAAADEADELVSSLSDDSATFEKAAKKAGLAIVSNTPRFSQSDLVKGVDRTAPFTRAAFALEQDETHYYSDPVVGRDVVYVISLVGKFDSFLPGFDVVREKVIESAKLAAAEKAYIEKAGQVHDEIEKAIKAGTPFAKAIAPFNMELKTTLPFNIKSTLEDEFGQEIMAATARFNQGTLSGLIPTPDEFLLTYVAKKELGNEAAELPAMRAGLAGSIGNDKAARLVAAWREDLLKEADFVDLLPRNNDSDES